MLFNNYRWNRNMSRTKTTTRRGKQVSEHVSNVQSNPFLPPGAPDADQANHPDQANQGVEAKTNEDYPAVVLPTQTVEEHAAAEQAATEERVRRGNTAKGPRKISEREKLQISLLIGLLPAECALEEYVIPMEQVPPEISQTFNATGNERNLFQRGFAKPVYSEDGHQLTGLTLTSVGMDLYERNRRKSGSAEVKQKKDKVSGEPRVGRATAQYDGLRIRKLVEGNPRKARSHGHYSFDLYRDGMSYNEYIQIKDYAKHLTDVNTPFDGPKRLHFEWDMNHGYIGLYRENEPETLENGEHNPRFWFANFKK